MGKRELYRPPSTGDRCRSYHDCHARQDLNSEIVFQATAVLAGHEAGAHHALWVPDGQNAAWIKEGVWALERQFDVAPFMSRLMVSAVLEIILPLIHQAETSQSPCEVSEAAVPKSASL